jgi:hypothetical protein
MATYGALVAMTLALGVAAPAQAATSVQVAGDTNARITAEAKVADTSLKKKERLHARATMTYKFELAGIPLPSTAAYYNSIPLTFGKPRLDELAGGDLDAMSYSKKRDPWLKTTQWIVRGDKGFWGYLKVSVKGSATAASAGQKYFHAGTGVGHAVDANSALRITVK